VAARGALTQGSKMLAKRIPLIGGVISGGLTALEGGSLLRSILVGGGSALGAVGGGIAGGAAGLGVGAAPGAIAGGMGGEWLGNKLADLIEGKKETTPGTAGEAPKEIGSMFNTLTDSSLSLNAAFSNMNSILSTGIIPNLSQLGANVTNIQGMPDITRIISERSSQISSDLQESLRPMLGVATTSSDNAIFQDTAQSYYQNSTVYYDRSLQLFTDIRDSNLNIRNDIATMRSLLESYVRTVRTLPQGAIQPSGIII